VELLSIKKGVKDYKHESGQAQDAGSDRNGGDNARAGRHTPVAYRIDATPVPDGRPHQKHGAEDS
jgi:hypothetical protein